MNVNIRKNASVDADYKSCVNIDNVFGGYFSNQKNIDDFINIGIKPILKELKNKTEINVASLAIKLNKPLATRLLLVPGKKANEKTNFNSPYLIDCKILDANS